MIRAQRTEKCQTHDPLAFENPINYFDNSIEQIFSEFLIKAIHCTKDDWSEEDKAMSVYTLFPEEAPSQGKCSTSM